MKVWLMRLCFPAVLMACTACGGQTSKVPTGAPNPSEKMQKPAPPPSLPKGPPKDAPAR